MNMKITEKDYYIRLKERLERAYKSQNYEEIQNIAEILYNPKYTSTEYYQQTSFTGFASIDKPHHVFFKKGTLDAKLPKMKMYDYLYLKSKNRLEMFALSYFGRKIRFREMFDYIEKTAKSLKNLGISEGDYVVISMPTTPEAVYLLFALNRIGAIPVEIDPRTDEINTKRTIIDSKAKLCITMEDNGELFNNIVEKDKKLQEQVQNILIISPTESLPIGLNCLSNIKDYIDRKKKQKPQIPNGNKIINWKTFLAKGNNYIGKIDSPYKENSVAEIIYTSGTTNTPKPIEYTNETFTAMVRQVELGENTYAEGDKNLDIIPLYLGFGSNNGIYTVLCFGVEDILIPIPVIENLPELIKKYKPNHLLGAPIHMKVLRDYLEKNKRNLKDLSYIKSIVSGSAHLDKTIQDTLNRLLKERGCKIKVGPGYGQNEAGPGLSFSSDSFLEQDRNSCSGYPLIFTTMSIFEPGTDNELKYGEDNVGEIRYQTPCVMKGYAFDKIKENSRFFRKINGEIWCCSGDLGKIDSTGAIYITGRIERQLHHNGFKFSPQEVEEYIMEQIPEIELCTLVGRPDEIEESIPTLFYVVKKEYIEQSDEIEQTIIEICKNLKDYKRPMEFIELEEMPYTKNLKVDFKKLEVIATERYKRNIKKLIK